MTAKTHLEGCEVNHTVDIWVSGKDPVKASLICDVDLVEIWSLAAEQFDAVEGHLGGVVQTVDDDDLVAMFEEGQGCK